MKILPLLIFLLPILSKGQAYTGFKWDEDDISFKTVEMEVSYSGEKNKIFKGFKDAQINIKQLQYSDPTKATVSVKLSGYFQGLDIPINDIEYKSKDYETTIIYSGFNESDFIYVAIYFDEIENKPKYIFASVTKNFVDKKSKSMNFVLTGFE